MTWATSVPILVFSGLSVLDLGPMYATDRQTSDRQTSDAQHRLMPPPYGGGGIIIFPSRSQTFLQALRTLQLCGCSAALNMTLAYTVFIRDCVVITWLHHLLLETGVSVTGYAQGHRVMSLCQRSLSRVAGHQC